MARESIASFDGREFFFEGQDGKRRILLNVSEAVMREGIQSMEEVRRHRGFGEQRKAFLSALLERLKAMGGGSEGMAASLAFLISVEAMSWNHLPCRFLQAGSGEDALSRGLREALALLRPGDRLLSAPKKSLLPEGAFDGVALDDRRGCPSSLAVAARKRLRPGGLLLCLHGKGDRRGLLHIPEGEGEMLRISPGMRLLLWRKGSEEPGEEVAFPRKKVVAFFPYKASMWDSLESIWRAADADEDAVAYVIPAPYGDRDEDRKVKEWHYELGEFPRDVPVIPQDQVDIPHLRPDIAYIHYPYEDANDLTILDERFHARNLRPHVGKLVYVPYFVKGGLWFERQMYAPCYPYVDKIVVQRPRIKVVPNAHPYVSRMEAGRTYFVEDFLPREKLLPLGSPKIDRIFWCEGHRRMPEEWEKRIGKRKVVLYNTSLVGLGRYGMQFLRKMDYVFRAFRGREDVVLLWRPHPLAEEMARRMGEEVHEGWLERKRKFLEEELGILDTMPDVDMSIAVADAYLGEGGSSIVPMFGFVGKPIFLTAMLLWEKPSEEELRRIWFSGCFFEGRTLYFRPAGYNALCRMDMETRELSPVLDFGDGPEGEVYGGPWRDRKHPELLYFSPNRSREILIYDLRSGKAERIPFRSPAERGNFGGMVPWKDNLFFLPNAYPAILRLDRRSREVAYFPLENPLPAGNLCGAVPYGDRMYFLSQRYPAIVEMDCGTGKLTYHRECMEGLLATRTPRCAAVMAGRCVRGGRYLLIAFRLTNRVMEFDMETGAWRYIEVGPEDVDSNVMLKESEDIYWLLPWQKAKIRRWNHATGECQVIEEYPEGYECAKSWTNGVDSFRFSYVRRVGEEVWLYPSYGNMMLKLDLRERRLLKWEMELPPTESRLGTPFPQQSMFIGMFDYNGKIWAERSYDRRFLVIDKKTREVSVESALHLKEETARSLMAPMEASFGPAGEALPYVAAENFLGRSVEAFLDYVAEGRHDRELQKAKFRVLAEHADGTCGEAIHEHMMKEAGSEGTGFR